MLIFSLELQQDLVDTSKESNLITKHITSNALPPDTAAVIRCRSPGDVAPMLAA